MKKREEISHVGSYDLVTQMFESVTTFGDYPSFRITTFDRDNKSGACKMGSWESFEFVVKNHGGAGMTLRGAKENKRGALSEMQIEIGKRDVEMLIAFLQKHLESLGEYHRDDSAEWDDEQLNDEIEKFEASDHNGRR